MIKNIPLLVEKISRELQTFSDVAVVGMSGGADSTLVSILCTLSFGKERVYSAHMPAVHLDHEKFNKNSWKVAEKLAIHKTLIPISEPFEHFKKSLDHSFEQPMSTLNAGNLKARIRMTTLYSLSCHLAETLNKRVRVIGTGNLSEDFIGYDTKGGDALCDIFPIGQLFKSEVYQLLEYFRDLGLIDEQHIDRTPSAGLWEGQTDELELGHSYNEMETSIRKIMKNQIQGDKAKGVDFFVYDRHLKHKHKHEASPVIQLREFCD